MAFHCEFPINQILTPDILLEYSKLFRYLWNLRRAAFLYKNLWSRFSSDRLFNRQTLLCSQVLSLLNSLCSSIYICLDKAFNSFLSLFDEICSDKFCTEKVRELQAEFLSRFKKATIFLADNVILKCSFLEFISQILLLYWWMFEDCNRDPKIYQRGIRRWISVVH